MKRTILSLLAATALGVALPTVAAAQNNINARQDNIEQRIDTSLRGGFITRAEANSLRADYQAVVRLEASYRSDGVLTRWERDQLDRRLDSLNQRIRFERRDDDRGALQPRLVRLQQDISVGVRRGDLTQREAASLQADVQSLMRLEVSYRRSGLTVSEHRDLERRFDRLSNALRVEIADNDRDRGNWGPGYQPPRYGFR